MARASAATGGAGIAGWAGAAAGLTPVQEAGERYLVTLVRELLANWHGTALFFCDRIRSAAEFLQVAGEVGSAVQRAKVQDWQPREPPRSAVGLSAWADGLIAYLQVAANAQS